MNSRRTTTLLSTILLVLLGLAAAGLSVLALTQHSSTIPVKAAPSTSPTDTSTSQSEPTEPVPTSQLSPSPQSSVGDDAPVKSGISVVILGDSHSSSDAPGVWVEKVAEELGWGTVDNYSSQGRGYTARPSTCDISVCSNFIGTIPAVVEKEPDVLVTLGGTADGDQDLSDVAAEYYAALREALPDVKLIAVSPVTSEDEAPYFLRLHSQTIRAGVEAVGGAFVDVGQPGIGDGDQLSEAAQDAVAQAIIAELS